MRYAYRVLFALLLAILNPITAWANDLNYSGNPITDGQSFTDCAASTFSFTASFSANATSAEILLMPSAQSSGINLSAGNLSSSLSFPAAGQTQNYKVRFLDATLNAVDSFSFSLNAFTVLQASLDLSNVSANPQEVCFNSTPSGSLAISTNGGAGPSKYIYTWETADNAGMINPTTVVGANANSLNLNILGALQGGADIFIRGEVTDTSCNTSSQTGVYQIITWDAFSIGSILGNSGETADTVCSMQAANIDLQISSSGGDLNSPISYSWKVDVDPNFSNPQSYSGVTLTSPTLGSINSTTYITVQVQDNCGSVFNSDTFEIYSWTPIQVTGAESSSTPGLVSDTLCQNTQPNMGFTVGTNHGKMPFTYVWQIGSDANFNSIIHSFPSQSAPSISANLFPQLTSTSYLRCIVSDNCSSSDTSNGILLYVHPPISSNIVASGGASSTLQEVCFGSSVIGNLTVNGTGSSGNYSYSWYRSDDAQMSNRVALGVNTPGLDLGANLAALSGAGGPDIFVHAVVKDLNCPNDSSSSFYRIVTWDALQSSNIVNANGASSDTVCFRGNLSANLNTNPSGGDENSGYKRTWRVANNLNFTNPQIFVRPTLTVSDLQNLSETQYVEVIVRDTCGSEVTKGPFEIFVWDSLYTDVISSTGPVSALGDTICNNLKIPFDLSAAVFNGDGQFSYRWEAAENAAFSINKRSISTGANLSRDSLGALTTSNYVRLIINDNCGQQDTSNSYFVKVWDPLRADSIRNSANLSTSLIYVCNGDPIGTSLQVDVAAGDTLSQRTYTWQMADDAAFTVNLTSPATTASLSSSDIGPLFNSKWVRAILDDGCGIKDTSESFRIHVWDPFTVSRIVAQSAPAGLNSETICNGSLMNYTLEVDTAGGDRNGSFRYRWEIANNTSFSNARNIYSFTLSPGDVGPLTETTYIRVTARDNSCLDSTTIGNFTVNVLPALDLDVLEATYRNSTDTSLNVCWNEKVDLVYGQTVGGLGNYQYEVTINALDEPQLSTSLNPADPAIQNIDTLLSLPGNYEITVEVEDSCNTLNSNTVRIKVAEPPYWDRLNANPDTFDMKIIALDPALNQSNDGSAQLCESQSNVLVRLDLWELNYRYFWAQSGNGTLDTASTPKTIAVWSPNGQNNLALAIQTQGEDCERGRSITAQASSGAVGPAPGSIDILNGTFLVDTEPNREGNFFQWSRIDREALVWDYLSVWDTTRFYNMNSPADTSKYIYVMASSNDQDQQSAHACRSYSYYPAQFSLNPPSFTIGVSPEVQVTSVMKLYPNPSTGTLFYELGEDEDLLQISCTDLLGRKLAFEQDAESHSLRIGSKNKRFPEPQLVLVTIHTTHQLKTFKVLLQ